MTDLEQFVEFFTTKGVEFHSYDDQDADATFWILEVGGTGFRFNSDGSLWGFYDNEKDSIHLRIPAPERK